MYPILYASITPGVVPTDLGLGTLSDCLSCEVQEARNGVYELEMTYPESGIHANEIEVRGVIKAKPNFTDDPQLFRIYKIGKVMRGKFTIYARHISYDLSGSIIESGTASTCITACELLENAANGFTIETDKNVTADFTITEPSSVRSWFAGKEGSLLDVYGTGEYKYDNFDVRLLLHRGQNRGVTLRYGKNLTELKQELNGENLVTGVIAFYKDADGVITKAPKVSTGLILDTEKDYAYDCSSLFDATPTVTQLTDKANDYISNHILTHLVANIKLNFVQIAKMPERVDLCDTVNIYLEALGIEATTQCIKTTWDVLKGRYSKTEFGEPKSNIADTIISIQETAKEAVSPSIMSEAIANATSKITGNQGGYVVLHDTNADQRPDEILVVDNMDLSQSVKVWRWNTGGLGYSSTGYNGSYIIALTNDGKIVADMITTGTMSANRVRTGTLSDQLGKNTLNLDTGEATFTSLKVKINNSDYDIGTDGIRTAFAADDTSVIVNSGTVTFNSDTFVVNSTNLTITSNGSVTATRFRGKHSLRLIDDNDVVRASMAYSTAEYSGIWLYDNTGTNRLATIQGNTNGGLVEVDKADGTLTGLLGNQAYGGYLTLRYNSSAPLAVIADNGTSGAGITLYRRNNILNARIITDTYGGLAQVYNTSGDGRVSIGVGNTDNGFIGVYSSSSNAIANIWNSGNGGTLHLCNPSGNIRVAASINSSDDGYLTLNDNQTHPSVQLFRTSNGFGAAYFHAGYDYTKLAVAITESVDGGGSVAVYGPSMSGTAVSMFYSGTTAGSLYLRAFDGTAKVYAHGESGIIYCVQCSESSSIHLKKNIFDISEGEAYKVLDLRPVSFDFKDGTSNNRRGFIAEEVNECLPNLVVENPETHLPNLNYTEIIPYLVKVCQIQEKRIQALEAQHG